VWNQNQNHSNLEPEVLHKNTKPPNINVNQCWVQLFEFIKNHGFQFLDLFNQKIGNRTTGSHSLKKNRELPISVISKAFKELIKKRQYYGQLFGFSKNKL
jgi:hypothetical protein